MKSFATSSLAFYFGFKTRKFWEVWEMVQEAKKRFGLSYERLFQHWPYGRGKPVTVIDLISNEPVELSQAKMDSEEIRKHFLINLPHQDKLVSPLRASTKSEVLVSFLKKTKEVL